MILRQIFHQSHQDDALVFQLDECVKEHPIAVLYQVHSWRIASRCPILEKVYRPPNILCMKQNLRLTINASTIPSSPNYRTIDVLSRAQSPVQPIVCWIE